MPRQHHRFNDPLAEARSAVGQLTGSPLDPVALELNRALEVVTQANSRGGIAGGELKRVASYVREIVRSLPRAYGDRFQFDAGLIHAMSTDWSGEALFSQMMIPCYETEWGYTRLPMPLTERSSDSGENKSHVVDLILLPKGDDIANVRLLDYPWIAHELSHILMFRFDHLLIPSISQAVTSAQRRLRLAAIADRGRARAVSQSAQEEFCRFWIPTPNHRNWAHELTADLIAAWVLGPAYLAAFEDLLGQGEKDPYQISTVHPPYAVRVAALLEVARRLHFFEHVKELEGLFESWGSWRWRQQKTNRYHFLADSEVISGLIGGAFQFCSQLHLRKWSNDRITLLAAAANGSATIALGNDLLTTAWLAFSRHQETYEQWESDAVHSIVNSLTL
jgi:hypothetical protein